MKQAILICLCVCAYAITLPGAPEGGLRVGAAKGNITPSLGAVPAGEWDPIPSTHIHDELWVRCMAFDDGHTRLALVVCDLLGVADGLAQIARQTVERETGVPASHIMISGTHTHSAPRVTINRYDEHGAIKLDAYQQVVMRRIADTVRCAFNNLEPAQVGWTSTQAPEHVFNRRWFLKPGTVPMNPFGATDEQVQFNPPIAGPNLVKPAGPTDPQLFMVAARRPNGTPIAVLSNYSLHYVGGKPATDISADYYGAFNNRVMELLKADHQDPPFVSLMSNGTSGDINNVDRVNRRPALKPYEKIRLVAHDLAQKVAAAYQTIEWHDSLKLGAALEEIELDFRRPTPEQVKFAEQTLAKMEKGQRPRNMQERYAPRVIAMHKDPPGKGVLPLQAFRIGSLGIAAFPMEVFCEIGLEMKARTPFEAGFSISLANGYFGYMPTPKQLELGGYETWLGTNRLEPEAAPKITERLLGMLTRLKAD